MRKYIELRDKLWQRKRKIFTTTSARWRIKLPYKLKTYVMFWRPQYPRCKKKTLPNPRYEMFNMLWNKPKWPKYSGSKMASPSATILSYLSIAWDGELGLVLTVFWRAVVLSPVLDLKVPIYTGRMEFPPPANGFMAAKDYGVTMYMLQPPLAFSLVFFG